MNLEDEELQLLAEEQMNRLRTEIQKYLNKFYDKTYILDSRVKSPDKLKMKQTLISSKKGYPIKLNDLPDIIGLRISVETEQDVEKMSELIKGLSPSKVMDYFNTPRENGFKAFLYYFENIGINVEIQIMTVQMMEWTNATHKEHDTKKYGQKI